MPIKTIGVRPRTVKPLHTGEPHLRRGLSGYSTLHEDQKRLYSTMSPQGRMVEKGSINAGNGGVVRSTKSSAYATPKRTGIQRNAGRKGKGR